MSKINKKNRNRITKSLFRFQWFVYLVSALCLIQVAVNARSIDWANSISGANDEYAKNIAVDESGNTYITGNLPNKGLLAKYDAKGNFLWSISTEGLGAAIGMGIVIDKKGNVCLTGYYTRIVDFDPGPNTASFTALPTSILNLGQDIFLAKYDSNGNYLWAKSMGGATTGGEMGSAIAIDNAGYLYIAGSFGQTADFDPGPGTATLSCLASTDAFFAKYDEEGNYVWAKAIRSLGTVGASDILVNATGKVCVTGGFSYGTIDVDPGLDTVTVGSNREGTARATTDFYLAQYNSSGNYLWAIGIGGNYNDVSFAVAMDAGNNIYVTGTFTDTVDFDPGIDSALLITDSSASDLFLAKYDSTGHYLWAKHIKSKAKQVNFNAKGMAIDPEGYVYIGGLLSGGAADFDPGPETRIVEPGKGTLFIAEYSPDGNLVWVENIGGASGIGRGYDLFLDRNKDIYVAGSFTDTLVLPATGGNAYSFTSVKEDVLLFKMICDTSNTDLTISLCGEKHYEFNDTVYTESGTYRQVFKNYSGCDSIVTLDLTLIPIEQPVIASENFVLRVTSTYATYQWIKNGTPVPEATGNTYEITENGSYQVAVSNEEGCTDTSEIFIEDNYTTEVNIPEATAGQVHIYPNPSADIVHIQAPFAIETCITSIEGKQIFTTRNTREISLKNLADGIYLLYIRNQAGILLRREKIIKQ